MKLLFCNTGWMNNYNGISVNDPISGGGSWIKENGTGGEIFNFSQFNGCYYGFVMCREQIHIEKLGADIEDDFLDDVLVIWLAREPKVGGVRVIGWYKHARVYRYWQKPIIGSSREKVDYWYNIEGKVRDSILLPVDERTFIIPRATRYSGGIGQSNVWYADGEKNKEIRKRVIGYIRHYELSNNKEKRRHIRRKKKVDIELKIQVELNAINAARSYYENLGYIVTSVENDNVGWDLEAILGKTILKIEVKGLSSDNISIALTPNEYENMKLRKGDYRIFILTNALYLEESRYHIFSYNSDNDLWMDYDENVLNVEEVVSARLFI